MPGTTSNLGLTLPLGGDAPSELRIAITNNANILDGFSLLTSVATAATSVTATRGETVVAAPGVTVTLPTATVNAMVAVVTANTVTGASPVTVAGVNIYGAGLSGASSFTLGTASACVVLQSDGTNWYIISGQPTLAAPTDAVRRTLLQTSCIIGQGLGIGDYLLTELGPVGSGVGMVPGSPPPPVWVGDAGLSSQPQDFQVTTKTAYARVRASLCVDLYSPGWTWTFGLYQITALGGGPNISVTFGSALAGTTVSQVSPGASGAYFLESGQFALPSAAGMYALGVHLSGIMAANSTVMITSTLLGYNA